MYLHLTSLRHSQNASAHSLGILGFPVRVGVLPAVGDVEVLLEAPLLEIKQIQKYNAKL